MLNPTQSLQRVLCVIASSVLTCVALAQPPMKAPEEIVTQTDAKKADSQPAKKPKSDTPESSPKNVGLEPLPLKLPKPAFKGTPKHMGLLC